MLHGVISFHEEAIPTWGFSQSASVNPTARNMARDAAFWMPSVTSRLRGLISTVVSDIFSDLVPGEFASDMPPR
jgi:hypothetical protein